MLQGVVTDEKGAYVKAAIVRLLKAKDSDDGAGAVTVTYAETDEEGRFVMQDLNQGEKYIVEIHLEAPESVKTADESVEEVPDTETVTIAGEAGTEEPAQAAIEEKFASPAVEAPPEILPEPDAVAVEGVIVPESMAVEEVIVPEPIIVEAEPEPEAVAVKAEPLIESEAEVLVLSSKVDIAEPHYYDEEPDFDDEEEAFAEGVDITGDTGDFVFWHKKEDLASIEYRITENLSFRSLYDAPGLNLKDKPYLVKNNGW